MPTKPATPCTQPGCPNRATYRGKCAEHAAQAGQRYNRQRGSSASLGYGPKWRRLRAAFLAEHPFCCLCRNGTLATEVDHIIPRKAGGSDDKSNLQSLCKPHHSAKTMRESVSRAT